MYNILTLRERTTSLKMMIHRAVNTMSNKDSKQGMAVLLYLSQLMRKETHTSSKRVL